MKVLLVLAASLHLVAAAANENFPPVSGNEYPPDYELPPEAQLITDPARLADLRRQHAEALESMNQAQSQDGDLGKRQSNDDVYFVPRVAGVTVIRKKGGKTDVADAVSKIFSLFTDDLNGPWYDQKYCRARAQTHAGGENHLWMKPRGRPDSPNGPGYIPGMAWVNPEQTAPPVAFFDNFPGFGTFSIQWTATDQFAWSGIPGTVKCRQEGLCHPQYVFYRENWNIVVNTWMATEAYAIKNDIACPSGDCEYLCILLVQYPHQKNGLDIFTECALPCIDDEKLEQFPTVPKEKPRIMIVGDSISHGAHEDWTWRYRLWQWFKLNVYDATFVGPYIGMHAGGMIPHNFQYPDPPKLPGEVLPERTPIAGGYAGDVSSEFLISGHGAWWGRQAAQTEHTIKGWVQQHNPDYLLLKLGFNDLGWFVKDAGGLIDTMGSLIQKAREAKPNIKILLGNVVHRGLIGGRQDLVDKTNAYNDRLWTAVSSWFRHESPIEIVDVASAYNCRPEGCPDGYDGLHPNAMGEYHIAWAFAEAFRRRFNIGPRALPVPGSISRLPTTQPAGQKSYGLPEGMLVDWQPQPNARSYRMRSRLQGMSDWWSEGRANGVFNWNTWVIRDQTWEHQACTCTDNDVCTSWGPITSAKALVETAPGPSNIRVVPLGSDAFEITWSPVAGYNVDRYLILFWDLDTDGAWIGGYATRDTRYVVGGLKPGHRYGTWVATYIQLNGLIVGGLPAGGREVRANGGAPGAPSGASATNLEPTTVRISWNPSPNAVGYSIYTRSLLDNTALKLATSTKNTQQDFGWLYPGTWYYEFCIASYNGNIETAPTTCVRPPKWPGYKRSDIPDNYTLAENVTSIYNTTTMISDLDLQMLNQLQFQQQEPDSSFIPSSPIPDEDEDDGILYFNYRK